MSVLSICYLFDRVEISGDIGVFNSPKIAHWLRTHYKVDRSDSEKIILFSDNFKEISFLFQFASTLQNRLKTTHISFDSAFIAEIAEEVKLQENFSQFSQNARNIWDNKYDVEDFKNFCDVIENRLSKRRLYKLQALSGYHMAYSQNSCNFSVPGAGKTSIVYSAFSYLNNLQKSDDKFVNKILVIGPPSSFDPWEDEYFECFGKFPRSIRINGELAVDRKKDLLKGITSEHFDLYLITYQSIPPLIEELKIFLRSEENKVMLICDEAHKFKSLDGIWAGSILTIARWARSRIVLTGTPAPNGYEDLYNLFKFLYPERNITEFRPDFLKALSAHPIQSEIDQLIDNIKPFFVRIKKSDLDLPEVIEHPIISNQLSRLETDVYDQLERAISSADSDINRQSIHFRMIQSCNNLNLLNKPLSSFDEGNFDKIESRLRLEDILGSSLANEIRDLQSDYIPSKHLVVENVVREIVRKGGKIILWGIFVDSIKRLHKHLLSCGFRGAYVIGETSKNSKMNNDEEITRDSIIRRFKNSELDYIISNPIVLGESISLHKICHNAVYFEQWYAAAPYVQSRDRIHRVWLDDNLHQIDYETNYYHIVSAKRADLDIHNRVQAKFARMMNIVEQDIPFFSEDVDGERFILIESIINDYKYLDKDENLLLVAKRSTLLQGLQYFSFITNENISNIFYSLTRSTTLKDVDINFLITYLNKANYISIENNRILRVMEFDPHLLLDDIIYFYYSLLINNDRIKMALFHRSEFTIINDDISINIFSVNIKYRLFFTVLQNLGMLVKTSNAGIVIIKDYTIAKTFLERPLKKLSLKDFENEQEQRKLNGIVAEKFVVEFENRRLNNAKKIDWVASRIVNEGYDISSFDTEEDSVYNRFIEVKSYQGEVPYFFWSRNEVFVAKQKQQLYWLYLVNRDRMNDGNYTPIMISDPYINVMDNNSWAKEVDKYKISYIG